MKFTIAAILAVSATAFNPASTGRNVPTQLKGMAEEVGIPCEDECALSKFPNLPESVHPGVVSGQAMMDLLNHAKENGEWTILDNHVKIYFCFRFWRMRTAMTSTRDVQVALLLARLEVLEPFREVAKVLSPWW